ITSEQARGFGLPDTLGALVSEVVPGSAAEKAGIVPGDVIRSADGVVIRQPGDLPPIVGNKVPGTKMKITVFREGRERSHDVTLGELDADAVASASGPRQGAPSAAPASDANALGLVTQDLTEAQRRQFGLDAKEGVGIARVTGDAAAEAGIRAGEVVLQVGRSKVGSVAELDRALRGVKAGETVMLLVRGRAGGSRFVAVTPENE
ncbi:MAG TPA: PDZ domain-containing protein, partial [Luteimonas sp.]|nr:PDZ domain-containing protein [Luteimonas sp.]